MHNIWNPWHGCTKISEGCQNCYMYFLDRTRDKNGSTIYKTKTGFDYPLKKDRSGNYKIQPGERISVCMTSDFFLEEADAWREEAWDIMGKRPDVIFWLLTKRAHRIRECLPQNWGSGWPNIWLGVTAENQARADERVPILLSTPAAHRHVCCAPFIGPVDISAYLRTGLINQVCAGGENYDGCRPCDHAWAESLYWQCRDADVTFCFYETGTKFIKDGQQYHIPKKQVQSRQAYLSGLHYESTKPTVFDLRMPDGTPIPEKLMHKKAFGRSVCRTCGNQYVCNGCSGCGKCGCNEPY